jgi:N-acetylmuramoyl-L-alanine amidase
MEDPEFLSTIRIVFVSYIFLLFFCLQPHLSYAYSQSDLATYQGGIVDHRDRLNPKYKKRTRKRTKYIIVHTSELGLKTTLRVVSKGKQFRSGRRTPGGHAHYVIARNGQTYRILDKKYVADHAGISMWDGETDISKISIGIELVGHHYASLTEKQYRSVGMLIDILQRVYRLDDRAVLTHSQIAYGTPNRWFKKNHRGRKRCAKNFVRAKAKLGPTWDHDPDVIAGRLMADPQLSKVFYSRSPFMAKVEDTNVITKNNAAWDIAGEDFDSETTVYQFPNGRRYTGVQVAEKIGWDRIPAKTVVLLNQERVVEQRNGDSPIKTIVNGSSAWLLAGKSYNRNTTIYFLPSGQIKTGSMISDWDSLPIKTRVIIGYKGPFRLRKDQYAFQIAGSGYKDKNTIYYLPSKGLVSGNDIKNFNRLQSGTLVFVPSS